MEKEDLRIVKTKIKLSNALVDLLKKKPMKDIKISELCELANVSRATFYNNFNSVDEVFTYYIIRFEAPFEENLDKEMQKLDVNQPNALSNMWKSYVFPLVEELEKRREDLCIVLTKQTMSGDFYLCLLSMMRDMMGRLLKIYKSKFTIKDPDELCIAYSSGGITSLLVNLLMSGDKYTLEEKQYYVFHLVFELSDYYFVNHQGI